MVVDRFDIFLVNLDTVISYDFKKSRFCLILSPGEMNRSISSVIIAPMTTNSRPYPTRVKVSFQGHDGWIFLDQIRTVDKRRLVRKLGSLDLDTVKKVKAVLSEMLLE